MAHVGAARLLSHARAHGYGIPCLLAGNLEMMLGACAGAERADAPLILAFNTAVTPEVPMAVAVPAMVTLAERACVPVATILDHGASMEAVVHAIGLGMSTVMYDGSHLSYTENVQRTGEVAAYAHAAGVDVEGELGAVGGSSIELGRSEVKSEMTDPKQVAAFVNETAIDILAPAFGNLHGVYTGQPALDLPLLRTIAASVTVPLAMHGGSGLEDAQYPNVIDAGVSKINYYTSMARAVTNSLRTRLDGAGTLDLVYHHVIDWTIADFAQETHRLLTLLRADGQALHFREAEVASNRIH